MRQAHIKNLYLIKKINVLKVKYIVSYKIIVVFLFLLLPYKNIKRI
jgi:hypothetical protein